MRSLVGIALVVVLALGSTTGVGTVMAQDLLFIHHSCGQNWLDDGLRTALDAKSYVGDVNEVTYGTNVAVDAGRPDDYLAPPEGDNTDMHHWLYWFNDHINALKAHDAGSGANHIIMFKSCYPNSDLYADGSLPPEPFIDDKTLVNFQGVFRHPDGSGNAYVHWDNGYDYYALNDVFAANPDTLFIYVTAPPRNAEDPDIQPLNLAWYARARTFNNWVKTTWLNAYNIAHPGLNNVAVFDWFDVLANADDAASNPNMLQDGWTGRYGDTDSHPNVAASEYSTQLFATNADNFLDTAWGAFAGEADLSGSTKTASAARARTGQTVTYTITVANATGSGTATVNLSDVVPSELTYVDGSLSATAGTVDDSAAPTLTWSGDVAGGASVQVTYDATVTAATRATVTNTAELTPDSGSAVSRSATVEINSILPTGAIGLLLERD